MNYKLLTGTLLASSVLLAACGNGEEKKENKTEETNKVKEKPTTEAPTTETPTIETPTTEAPTTETPTTETPTTEIVTTEAPVAANYNNITSQSQLETIIYSPSISEVDKVAAYNSAVRNGVIPQGTVMEGPAIAAYESSVAIQNGVGKKEQMAQRYQSWVDSGLMTEEEMEAELAKFD
ncbi:hypothetical protein CW697_05425 [Macrococcoides caseolyticum]|uniref:hypothetical protein n=1 Tax=Macrococcoides caseolyticum TaxID=69966 RepID=UPI000C334B29|nr:hypothetical protein [Macrococcus caseolyticus]PKF29925.1 hypothetical protein CW697_05425 [Macrococcus caseolyticus]